MGTSLSGGVDSSAIMAEATRLGHRGYHSFTVTSDDPRVDEGPAAKEFATAMGSTWHPVRASGADFAATWDRLTWHQESPAPSTSLYGQWKVMEAARSEGVIVLLDGQGADEVLGGYHKFLAGILLARIRSRDPSALAFARAYARHLGGPRTLLAAGYRYLGRFGRTPDLTGVAAHRPPTRWRRPRHPGRPAHDADRGHRALEPAQPAFYADRSSMAFGVEARLPYLDPQLAALALGDAAECSPATDGRNGPFARSLADRTARRLRGGGASAGSAYPSAPGFAGRSRRVDDWRRAPHPLWAEIVDPVAMRQHADAWARARWTSAAWDGRIFELVALDRFFRTWFAG